MDRDPLCATLLSALCCLVLAAPQAYAHEAWRISEIFTSGDGELQYITLFSDAPDQNQLDGITLTTRNAGGELHGSYTYASNPVGSTAQATLLISTQALADHAGISPDFIIPAGFLPTEGGSVDFAGIDTLIYAAPELPKNGNQALRADTGIVNAMPTNFAGETAAVQAEVMTRFEDTTGLLHLPVVAVPGMDTVSAWLMMTQDDPIELTLYSAYEYLPSVSAEVTGAAVLSESGILYVPQALVGNEIFEANLTLLDDVQIVFGNLEVLSITLPTPPDPDPPQPDPPQPDPLEASINAGEQTFASVCATCHGPSGAGTVEAPSLITSSLRTLGQLQPFIQANMPFGNPGQCVDSGSSSCATDAANFIIHRIQSSPPPADIDPEGAY